MMNTIEGKECEKEMQGYNPYTIKTDGMKRNFMELITSERHAIGNYKRCAYEYETMDNVIHKLDKMGPESELNNNKLQLLKSYTKHYQRFKKDLDILNKFGPEKLKKEFESSKDMDGRTGKWRENLNDWGMENHPRPPARIQSDYNIQGGCLLPVRAKAKIRGNKYGATRSAGDYRRKVLLARLCAKIKGNCVCVCL